MKRFLSVLIVCGIATATFALFQPAKAQTTDKSKAKPPAVVKDDAKTDKTNKIEKKKEPILRKFMRQKLEASNMVLEGLVTDDLGMVEVAADRMLKMSKAELWRTMADRSYARYSNQFVRAVERLKAKSKKAGSVDGAALAWMNVTHSCIECHEWVRNVIIADVSDFAEQR